MFHRYGKKGASIRAKSLKDLTKIVSIDQLLSDEKRIQLMQQIRESCALETPRFDSLCLSIVHNLINHCQSLPETSNSYYSQPVGLVDHALNRTEAALNLFKQYLLLDEKTGFSEEQKLWQYALLSAAVLQGIGKLQIDYTIEIYDNTGHFLKQWNPLLESLALIGSHYTYSFQKESDVDFRRRLNILLARLLMPSSGFAWIASNPQVLAVWLALLNEDHHAAGTLGAILIRADSIAIQRYFNQQSARNYGARGGRYGRAGTFTGGIPESLSDIEQQMAIDFLQWLNKSLTAGIIMINKAPLFMVPGGLLMSPDIFKWFVREHPEFKNWQAIQNAFLSLGLHKTNPDGSVISRFEQNNTQQMHTGILLSDYAVILPAEVSFHHLPTGKTSVISATELIHAVQFNNYFTPQQHAASVTSLPVLDAAGEWAIKSGAVPVLPKPGVVSGA